MSPPLSSALLTQVLQRVARRYRVPQTLHASTSWQLSGPATALAALIEQARMAATRHEVPDRQLETQFAEALARLIDEAMGDEPGDAAYQALVMRHMSDPVREYASLLARARQDRRSIRIAIDAVAHPARQVRMAPSPMRDTLAALHATASYGALADQAERIRDVPEAAEIPGLIAGLDRLLQDRAIVRLQRLEVLLANPEVQRYQALCDQNGPRQGSAAATAQGAVARRRGADVEALATRALQAVAARLNQDHGAAPAWRVVTSLRVPASMPASAQRAKSEWDAVLLSRARQAPAGWNVCLLLEAKASPDAAATDLPRLLRGLRLLAQADAGGTYAFSSREGVVKLRGDSLRTLPTAIGDLAGSVLYCCNAPADGARLLGAASRMQLLSAPPSLHYASRVALGLPADASLLKPVWRTLLHAPAWRKVLHQYPMLHDARALMVHTDDLLAAVVQPEADMPE